MIIQLGKLKYQTTVNYSKACKIARVDLPSSAAKFQVPLMYPLDFTGRLRDGNLRPADAVKY
jgi:hypothetical protein